MYFFRSSFVDDSGPTIYQRVYRDNHVDGPPSGPWRRFPSVCDRRRHEAPRKNRCEGVMVASGVRGASSGPAMVKRVEQARPRTRARFGPRGGGRGFPDVGKYGVAGKHDFQT